MFAKFHDLRTPLGSVRAVWIPPRHLMSSSSAAMVGEKQRKKMMNRVVMIEKGRSFMGFEMISMDEVIRGLLGLD